MKNRRGEIATLLTLGLVLVGGLITLATSFIVNRQQNLASNPRAAVKNCLYPSDIQSRNLCKADCGTGQACAKCNNGNYRCAGTSDDSIGSTPVPSVVPTSGSQASSTTGCGSGNRFACDHPDINKASCPKDNLEFACCVQDKFQCAGGDRYRWYGCTGQPCGNTKISQSNGPGYLVACPKGVGPGNVESCAVALTPTASPGKTGQPCKQTYVGGSTPIRYECDGKLVCSSQNGRGTCISPSATPRPSQTAVSTTPIPPTLAPISGGTGTGATCVPVINEEIAFGYSEARVQGATGQSCGGVLIHNTSRGKILRECASSINDFCKYSCFEMDGNKANQINCFESNNAVSGTRKITIVNDSGKDQTVRFTIGLKGQGQIPVIAPINISAEEGKNFYSFDFGSSNFQCKSANDEFTFKVFYKEKGSNIENMIEGSDTCGGWYLTYGYFGVNLLEIPITNDNDINVLIRIQ